MKKLPLFCLIFLISCNSIMKNEDELAQIASDVTKEAIEDISKQPKKNDAPSK